MTSGITAADTAAQLLKKAAREVPVTSLMTGIARPPRGGETVPARRLASADWLSDQVQRVARRRRTGDLRVAGTLWWYSASNVLLAPPLVTGLLAGRAVAPGPEGVTLCPEPGGRLLAAVPRPDQPLLETAELGEALHALLETLVAPLAGVSGMRPRPLWALAADSLAGVLLRTGRESGRTAEACDLAVRLAGAVGGPLPRPRWSDAAVPDGGDGLFPVPPAGAPATVRFVRRGSCCLLYETGGEEKCTSCPRRTPADRQVRLEVAASRLACSG